MLDGLNFKEFVAFLSAFSSRATLQQKIECNHSIICICLMILLFSIRSCSSSVIDPHVIFVYLHECV